MRDVSRTRCVVASVLLALLAAGGCSGVPIETVLLLRPYHRIETVAVVPRPGNEVIAESLEGQGFNVLGPAEAEALCQSLGVALKGAPSRNSGCAELAAAGVDVVVAGAMQMGEGWCASEFYVRAYSTRTCEYVAIVMWCAETWEESRDFGLGLEPPLSAESSRILSALGEELGGRLRQVSAP